MRRVLIIGCGMTPFGNHRGAGIRSLAVAALDQALADSRVLPEEVGRIFFGNAAAGVMLQQEMIRGQVALRHHPLARAPLFNVENACASGSSAVNLAFDTIRAEAAEVVIAVGVEVLHHRDKSRAFRALRGSTDIEEIGEGLPGETPANSVLMEYYAGVARQYLEKYDATAADFALVAVKNRRHAAANPLAQFRVPQSVEDVLGNRMVVPPLTLPMCSPMTDGAAALVLCSEEYAKRRQVRGVEVVACRLAVPGEVGRSPVRNAVEAVYETSGYGARDFDLIELHDAAAPAELQQYAEIGLCEEGEGHHLIRRGETALGGAIPINTSGGLLSRGHPLGATGCAQLVELYTQLQGRAGARQVADAGLAMAVNGGGWLHGNYAVTVATILREFSP
ncbi:MAG TPA: thiolase family protein [Steroidobacteraceae bacterium]|nr:thiolase family protein [Steroidobacteraceae bacterium]